MKNFIIALQFLTRITIDPTMKIERKDMAASAPMYPLVGLCIGALLLLLYIVLTSFLEFSILSAAIFLAVAEIVITGGLHFDGLMDCADGLLSYRPKERIMAIMKDSHVGANAVIAFVSILLIKVALLVTVLPTQYWLVVLMPLISRWVLLDLACHYPYAGKEGSLGGSVIGQVGSKEFWLGTGYTLAASFSLVFIICSLLQQTWLVVLFFTLLSWFITALVARYLVNGIVRKIGGITGDVLGAILELAEVVVLFLGTVLVRIVG